MGRIKAVRIYQENEDGVTAVATDYMRGADGRNYKRPIRNKSNILISAIPKNCILIKNKNLAMAYNDQDVHYGMPYRDNYTRGINRSFPESIQSDEFVNGGRAVSRNEQPGLQTGMQTLKFCLENTTNTAITHVIGDSHNMNNLTHGYGALPAGLVVSNQNWGQQFLVILQKVTGDNPIRLHELHITNTRGGAPSTMFYSEGSLFYVRQEITKQLNERRELDFSLGINGNQYSPSIQKMKEFRYLLDGHGGLEYNLPAGEKICITMRYAAIATSYSMVKR